MNKLLSLPLYYKKIIANCILLVYHQRYTENRKGMYNHWTTIKENDGKLFLIKCYQHESSCVCNKENPVNIDRIFRSEYDYVMKLISEHTTDINSNTLLDYLKIKVNQV